MEDNRNYLFLKRVMINNWGDVSCYEFTFDQVTAMLGVNGSGKTTVVDAIYDVLNGTLSERNHNISGRREKGNKAARKTYDYVIGSRRDKAPWRKDKIFTTTVALEWYDQEKDRYYCNGVMIEHDPSAAKNKSIPEHRWFIMNGPLPDEKFINSNYDELKSLCEQRAREHALEKPLVSQVYQSSEKYTADLCGKVFGNVDSSALAKLTKSAVGMKIDEDDTSKFIKEFLFVQGDQILASNVSAQAQEWKRFSKELHEKKVLLDELTVLADVVREYNEDKERYDHARDVNSCAVRLAMEEARDAQLSEKQKQLTLYNECEEQKRELEIRIKDLSSQITDLNVQIRQSDYGKIKSRLDDVRERREIVQNDLSQLRVVQQQLKQWTEHEEIDELIPSDVYALLESFLNGRSFTEDDIARLSAGLEETKNSIRDECREWEERVRTQKQVVRTLKDRLEALRENRGVYPNQHNLFEMQRRIKQTLNDRYGKAVPVEIFSKTFDVMDLEWKNAVEGRLTEKRYLITPPEYSKAAMDILRAADKQYRKGVSVIDTEKIMQEHLTVKEDSLYEAVSHDAPAYIDAALKYYLGRIVKCETVEDLQSAGNGVTKDCYSYVKRASWHINRESYTDFASIGKRVSKQLVEETQHQLEDAESELEQIRNRMYLFQTGRDYTTLNGYGTGHLVHLLKTPKEAQRLQKQEADLCATLEELKANGMDSLQRRLERVTDELNGVSGQRDNVLKRQSEARIKAQNFDQEAESLSRQISNRPVFSYDVEQEAKNWLDNYTQSHVPRLVSEHLSAKTEDLKQAYENKKALLIGRKDRFSGSYPGYNIDGSDAGNQMILDLWEKESAEYNEENEKGVQAMYEKTLYDLQMGMTRTLQAQIKEAERRERDINRELDKIVFGAKTRYRIGLRAKPGEMGQFYDMIMDDNLALSKYGTDESQLTINDELFRIRQKDIFERFIDKLAPPEREEFKTDQAYQAEMREFEKNMKIYSDYRSYLDFVMLESKDEDASDRRTYYPIGGADDVGSGGEIANPKYAILYTGFQMLYARDIGRNVKPRFLIMDEAFEKLDSDRIKGVLRFSQMMNLQILIVAPQQMHNVLGNKIPMVYSMSKTAEDKLQIGRFRHVADTDIYLSDSEEETQNDS